MRIFVNSEPVDLAPGSSVAALLEQLGLAGRWLAVEVNTDVIVRSAHATHLLQEGDTVEIVHAIGGG